MDTQQQRQFKILLIGDNCTDIYQYGYVDRISPEAPIPIFVKTYQDLKYGMAGNVLSNLFALGCDVDYFYEKTSTKTRLIDVRSKQQIVRIDSDLTSEPVKLPEQFGKYDAVVISDYNKGTVSYQTIREVMNKFDGPIFIDTKKINLDEMEGCFVKINELEYSKLKTECSNVIVTLGSKGAKYKDNIYPAEHVEVSDVCGAGDTFLAALTYQFLKTKDIEQSIKFAIKASSVTVQHLGNYAPSLREIYDAFRR
jgi:D-beta-D-heptose 7-phosphate kinase/D-beta-D-heptose 1-phosphate adenosyltransferase